MKILVTDHIHECFMQLMHEIDIEVDYRPEIEQHQLEDIIGAYEGLMVNSKTKVNRTLMDLATNLRFIGRMGSGMEIIDQEYAKTKEIICFNSPEGNSNAVGEHALGMLLCLLNNVHIANEEVKRSEWNRETNRGFELSGLTVGIIGFGHTGSAFAKVLGGFNVRILAYDKYKSNFASGSVEEVEMHEIYSTADILSLHLPMTSETLSLVNSGFIREFKKEVFLINTSRGKVVNQADLMDALKSNRIRGVALDVLENEKLETFSEKEKFIFNELAQMSNVLLTPHIAGWTFESKKRIAEILAQHIRALISV